MQKSNKMPDLDLMKNREDTYFDEKGNPYLFEHIVEGILVERQTISVDGKRCIIEKFEEENGKFQKKIRTDPKWFGITSPVYEYDAIDGADHNTYKRGVNPTAHEIFRAARQAVAIVYGRDTEGASETEETKAAPEMKIT